MNRETTILLLLSAFLLLPPSGAFGQGIDISGINPAAGVSETLDGLSNTVSEEYEQGVQAATQRPRGVWAKTRAWAGDVHQETQTFVMGLSIVERLLLGIALALFSLGVLYVLLFKSSVSSTFPRFLFRMVLISVVFFSSSLSYMTLTRSLIQQPAPQPSVEEEHHFLKVKERTRTIRELEQDRMKNFDEAVNP